jgi:hypothetical protein
MIELNLSVCYNEMATDRYIHRYISLSLTLIRKYSFCKTKCNASWNSKHLSNHNMNIKTTISDYYIIKKEMKNRRQHVMRVYIHTCLLVTHIAEMQFYRVCN